MAEAAMLLDRAELLLEQGRHKDAQTNINQVLELDPENDYALALLCRCHYANKQYGQGIDVVVQAISLDPHNSFYFYLLSFGYYQQDQNLAAIENLRKAIRLNPYAAEYFGLLAYVLIGERGFDAALEKANEGLAIDAENITCLNARSVALNKLKRTDAAIETMQYALAQDPDNEVTHATVGWNLLEKGKHREATKHFFEALRINPNYENAKTGLKEALKSKVFLYKWLLQYSFWVNNRGKNLRIALPIVLYIIFRILIAAFSNSSTSGIVLLLVGLYLLIVVTSWTINSIANFILLFNSVGKYALTNTERWSSIAVVSSLVAGLILLGISGFSPGDTQHGSYVFIAGLVCLSLALPLGSIDYPITFKTKQWRDWFSLTLIGFGILSLLLFSISPSSAFFLFAVYGVLFIIYNWTSIGR